jgi:carbon starvation protein
MRSLIQILVWTAVAALGAWAYGTLAFHRGEPLSSAYILVAALCTYAIGYRFYSKWIAARVLLLDDRRATPCEVHEDGKDFVKTNKWIVFGHHFAAISGPGPLVGPVLAAQFGYLPGTLWILIGVVLGGAVQDFVILFASMRRDGKSLGQMVKEELNSTVGAVAMVAILAIMVILLAVLGLVVVKALAESPWGVFTVAATIPIAMFMGGYLRFLRVGKVLEVSAIGVVLLLLAVWGGQFVHSHVDWARVFTIKAEPLAWSIIGYGLLASILPVWLLLAPRDYLSTFMKLGTIAALAAGTLLVLPDLKMPALTRFIDGSGLVVAGGLFPFCFITIACGAISGFHTLISSGITPKIITREGYARPIGYGAMCLESLVAVMAMIAACTLDPGVYLAMNVKGAGPDQAAIMADTVARVNATGFSVNPMEMDTLASEVGEASLYGRTGGAATLAVGMAQIFSQVTHGRWLDLWYHFAIMFEALFILTTLDAGTRVGRYLLQDTLGHLWKPLGDTRSQFSSVFASALIVFGWGYFLIQGVRDPLGGINSLWPLFGIANQLLAAIALCLGTTILLKMALASRRDDEAGKASAAAKPSSLVGGARSPWMALVTLLPLVWLLSVTFTAGWQKMFHADPRIGFATQAAMLQGKINEAERLLDSADARLAKELPKNRRLLFNARLNLVVTAAFLLMAAAIVVLSVREWLLLIARKKLAALRETEPVWLPDYAVAEGQPWKVWSLFALGMLLLKEVTGQSAYDRASARCVCAPKINVSLTGHSAVPCLESDGERFARVAEERFNKPNRCC